MLDFEDNFQGNKLKVEWNWNYPYSDIDAVVKKGQLSLSGILKRGGEHGTVLCLCSQSPDYTCETKVVNANQSLKGLTLYGDDKNHVVWGTSGDKLLLKVVKDNVESVLYETVYPDKEIYLKTEVERGYIFHFFWSKDGKTWNFVNNTSSEGNDLIRWDRVQRPGLLHNGAKNSPAEFAYFKMRIKKRTL